MKNAIDKMTEIAKIINLFLFIQFICENFYLKDYLVLIWTTGLVVVDTVDDINYYIYNYCLIYYFSLCFNANFDNCQILLKSRITLIIINYAN